MRWPMIAIEKIICFSSQEKGLLPHSGGAGHTLGSTSVSWEAEERGRAMGKGLYFYGFLWMGTGEAGWTGSGIQGLCPAGWYRALMWLGQVEYESWCRRWVAMWTQDWLVCVWKALMGRWFTISRNWLTLGGRVPLRAARSPKVKTSEYRK